VTGTGGAEATVDTVTALLRARGERMTGPRRAVLSVLAADPGHLSADDVHLRVSARDPGVHRASVYRALDMLTELGVVQHVHTGRGVTTYHLIRGERPHLHAQCRVCGTVLDLPEDLLDTVAGVLARDHGFLLDAGHVALSGVCRCCDPVPPAAPATDTPEFTAIESQEE
jgi:Fur family transcriptional regulator, ferric uptake regulator